MAAIPRGNPEDACAEKSRITHLISELATSLHSQHQAALGSPSQR